MGPQITQKLKIFMYRNTIKYLKTGGIFCPLLGSENGLLPTFIWVFRVFENFKIDFCPFLAKKSGFLPTFKIKVGGL